MMTIEMYRKKLVDDRRERYIKLKTALLDFQAITFEYSDCGTRDSEPDRIAQGMIFAASEGIEPKVFTEASKWKLFQGTRSNKCAKLMANKMSEIVNLILGFDFIDDEVMGYLKSFCWRFID